MCSKGSNLKLINWSSFIATTTLSNESLYLCLVLYSTVYCLVAAFAFHCWRYTANANAFMHTHPHTIVQNETNSCKPVLNPLNLCALKAMNSSKLGPTHGTSMSTTHKKQNCFSPGGTQINCIYWNVAIEWLETKKRNKQDSLPKKMEEEFFEKSKCAHTRSHWKPNRIE